jgi:energy-coupling factor transporter ATP-binding protein EcfA2
MRAEFSSDTRELTARRAGYRCSLPICGCLTIGPSIKKNKYSCIGEAAHIYAASPSGPRGTGGLSAEERQSPENAIWLCRDHAGLIDKNNGIDYSASLLLSYKALHEARMARELRGYGIPLGWIEGFRVNSCPLFSESQNIEFGKLTLIVGGNGAGKTALCEWLAATVSINYLQRWVSEMPSLGELDFEVFYLNPERHCSHIKFSNKDFPEYYLDGKYTGIPSAPIKVVFPKQIKLNEVVDSFNDIQIISNALNLEQYEVLALADLISKNGTKYVKKVWFEMENGALFLYTDVSSTKSGLSFRLLAESEKFVVLMEFAILAATRLSEVYPTVLILDAYTWHLDADWFKRYGEFLSSPTVGFQTIASIPIDDSSIDPLRWSGWKVIRLQGQPPDVRVSSDIRETSVE